MPGEYNIVIPQGDTLTTVFTWTTCASGTKTPVDLTGYSAELVVYTDQDNPTYTFNSGDTSGSIVLGGTAGTIALDVQTQGLEPGCYSYYLRLTSSSGVVTTLITGAFQLQPLGDGPCEVTI